MRLKKVKESYSIELVEGEELIEALTKVVTEHRVDCAWLRATGNFRQVELVEYEPKKGSTRFRTFADLELASLLGKITMEDGKPVVNAHGVKGGVSFRAWVGRINKAVVASGVELLVTPLKECIKEETDFWNFPTA